MCCGSNIWSGISPDPLPCAIPAETKGVLAGFKGHCTSFPIGFISFAPFIRDVAQSG